MKRSKKFERILRSKIRSALKEKPRKSVIQPSSRMPSDIILYGINNENTIKIIDKDNTLVFACRRDATKPEIKEAIKELYGANVTKVRTLITMKGYKKAFVVIKKGEPAADIANDIGMI